MTVPTNGGVKRNIVGQITANTTTAVTTIFNNLKQDSVVILSLNTAQGTAPGQAYVSNKTPATGVVEVKSLANDTSIYDILVFQ